MNYEHGMIFQGDCLEIMKSITNESIDLILCDLPYGVTQNSWDSIIPLDQLWINYKRLIKPNGAIVLTATMPFGSKLIESANDIFRYDLIWEKSIATGFLNANRMPLRGHESILVFYKKLPVYNPQKFMLTTPSFKKPNKIPKTTTSTNYGKYTDNIEKGSKDGSRHPRSVFSIKTESSFFGGKTSPMIHPTQKPIALFEYLIRTYTNEHDLILDNCAGSMTTAIAAIKTNRKFICIEKEDTYFNSAKNRIEDYYKFLQFGQS